MDINTFKTLLSILCLLGLIFDVCAFTTGISYSKYSGTVGPAQKIRVDDNHIGSTSSLGYHAKPEYHFSYGVKDDKNKLFQSRKESRHGDEVVGEYSVLDPDGKLRTVKYTANKHDGFNADIYADGKYYGKHYPLPIEVHDNHVPSSGGGHDEEDDENGGNDDDGGDDDSDGGDEHDDGTRQYDDSEEATDDSDGGSEETGDGDDEEGDEDDGK